MPSQPLLSPPPFFVSIEDSYKRGLRGLSRRDCLVFPPTAAVLPCSTGRRRHLLMHPSRSFFGASISRFSFASFTFVCLKIYVCLFALGSVWFLPPRRLQMRVGTLFATAGLCLTGTTAFQSTWTRGPQVVKQQQPRFGLRNPFARSKAPSSLSMVATDEALLQTGPGGGGGLLDRAVEGEICSLH